MTHEKKELTVGTVSMNKIYSMPIALREGKAQTGGVLFQAGGAERC